MLYTSTSYRPSPNYNILISGGSGGLGHSAAPIQSATSENYFFAFCAENKKLQKEIKALTE
jgi:NADPH:quinone reductase-like Zn-dependent oxidoreductase